MSDDGLDAARALLPGVRLDAGEILRDGERATVRRVRASGERDAERSLIVKQFHSAGEGWVRESAALEIVPAGLGAPQVIASGAEPPVLVLEDLGEGPSVADALLGADPAAAERSVLAWTRAVAALHVATRNARPAFRAALDARQGELPVDDTVWSGLGDTVRVLDGHCAALGVPVPGGALDELRAVADRLSEDRCGALTPADTCPDNNVLRGDQLVLVDYEGAHWRHIAWDVAYLRVPWPTCWCSWLLPDDLAGRALDVYRDAATGGFPQVEDDAFEQDVEIATAAWSLITAMWFLSGALDSDAAPATKRPTPTRRALVLHRLRAVAVGTELPRVAELAGGLATELTSRWGDVPLAPAPAFLSPAAPGPPARDQ